MRLLDIPYQPNTPLSQTLQTVKNLAKAQNDSIAFQHNGVLIIVRHDSSLLLIERDVAARKNYEIYGTVGPYPPAILSTEEIAARRFNRRRKSLEDAFSCIDLLRGSQKDAPTYETLVQLVQAHNMTKEELHISPDEVNRWHHLSPSHPKIP